MVSHDSFARSLAFVLANRLEDSTLHSTELSDIFHTVLKEHPEIREAAVVDIVAFRERVGHTRSCNQSIIFKHWSLVNE